LFAQKVCLFLNGAWFFLPEYHSVMLIVDFLP